MEIDDTRHEFRRTNEGLVVAALQFEILFVDDFNISSLDLHPLGFEHLRTYFRGHVPSKSGVYSARGGRMMAFQSCSYPYDKPNM
jgi:hypothetical protein